MAKKPTALEKLAAATVPAFERKEPRPNVAFDMESAILVDEHNKTLDWNIFGALEEAPVEMNMTGASEIKLTCHDPRGELLNDPIFANWLFKKTQVSKSSARTFSNRKVTDSNHTARYGEETEEEWTLPQRQIDLNLDGIWFRLSGFATNEDKLTLIFEDRVAAILRSDVGSLVTVERGAFTRAMFVKKLARLAEHNHRSEGKIPTFIPEEKIQQVIAEDTSEETATDLRSSSSGGVGANDGITVGGVPADSGQLKVINELLEVAVELKAPFKAQAALIYAAIGETKCGHENSTSSAGTKGTLQSLAAPFDTPSQARAFLRGEGSFQGGGGIALARTQPHATIPEIAVLVEVPSIWPSNRYASESGSQHFLPEAEHIVRTFGGTTNSQGEETGTVPAPYNFTRGPAETSWDCIQRLASEVSWYAFVRDNTLWYVSGNLLYAQTPQIHVERGQEGVDWVNTNIELGARDGLAEVEVVGRASIWSAVPGNAVNVQRNGPANGRWVVDSVTFDALDRADDMTAKLYKPLPARPEPAPNGSVESSSGEPTGGAGPRTALAAFNASSALSEMQLPYLWGGGHQAHGLEGVKKGGPGLDCSGSTCWVLKQAGMFPGTAAVVSGELEKWGVPGKGSEMTVWASGNHVFIEYTIPGHDRAQMNTNHPAPSGPRLDTLTQTPTYNMNPAAEGYVARHWPGT